MKEIPIAFALLGIAYGIGMLIGKVISWILGGFFG